MAAELVDRLAIFVEVRRFPCMGVAKSRYCIMRIMSTCTTFRSSIYLCFLSTFLGDVQREFKHRLYAALRGTLGSYLRDALHEGIAHVVVCLNVPRALACGALSSLLLLSWWFPMPFLVNTFRSLL
jgi:hypothetical protein